MNNKHDKDFWLKEANRHLAIALLGIPDANRIHVEKAMECLGNYQKMIIQEKMR
jgi:hypothetical protein